MNTTIEITALTTGSESVVISTNLAKDLNLNDKKVSHISFGAAKCYVEVRTSDKLDYKEFQMSYDISEHLKIPKYLSYEIRNDGDGIILGPVIGFLMSRNKNSINTKSLKNALAYVSHYKRLNGAVIIFSLDCVNKDNHTISGYCYNPKKNSWEEGVFPYPSAIYRRLALNKNWRDHFLTVIGDNLFYNYYFNKWEMYQWFSKNKEMSIYFPETTLYSSSNDIQAMLNKYGKLYAKPIASSGGKGVIQIYSEGEKIVYKYRDKGVNQQICFDTISSAKEYGAKLIKEKKYILQQPIELMKYQGNIFDIRCMMLRNSKNKWDCSGIVGRIASKGGIASNAHSGGTPTKIDVLLRKYLGYSISQSEAIKNELKSVSVKAAECLDSYGIKAAVLGIDIGLDKDGKLWIIEINIRYPGLDIFTFIGDYRMVDKTKTSLMLYGKHLAGFASES